MLKNSIPFMDAETGTTVAAGTPATEATPATAEPAEAATADEPKNTGVDIKAEAQKLADAIVAKKLKGMPSKEEVKAFHEWKESQKTEAEKYADRMADADRRVAEAEAKASRADAYILASKAGIQAEHIDDAVILAMARANDDTTIEEAIMKVAESNPAWKAGTNLGNKGGNPPEEQDNKNMEIKTFF